MKSTTVPHSNRYSTDDAQSDSLLPWEWLFLHVILLIASYALSLQPQIQSLSWYLIYLLSMGLFLLRYGAFLGALWIALPLLAWPALAVLSYFWSDEPGQTLRTSIQLAMTVLISAYLGSRFSLFDITRALFVVLTLTALLSLPVILLKAGFAYDDNGVARGIFPHKNVLGGRMVLLLLCSLLLFVQGWHRMTTAVCAALSVTLIAFSESSTAIIMTLGLCVLAPLLLTRGAPAPLRMFSYLAGLAGASIGVWALLAFDLDVVGMALEALGKERTLTGRSVLWEFAMTQINARPWLGGGFDAFWNGGAGSTGEYVQYVIRSDVKNFHNSYLDIMVQLGVAGIAVTGAFLFLFAWRAAALLRADRAPLAALPAFFLAFVLAYSLSEYAVFRQHSLIQLLLGIVYVSAALAVPAPLRRPAPSRRQASAASLRET
jgi:exopolysaccharide production protein ExoQ